MSTTHNWTRLDRLVRFLRMRNLYGILSAESFRAIIERERARADRYGYGFSLLVFDVGNTDRECPRAKNVADVIRRRKRSTDEIGWFNDQSIGIIMPSTSENGARKFAQAIYQRIRDSDATPHYRVYRYPSQSGSLDKDPPPVRSQKVNCEASHPSEMKLGRTPPRECNKPIERLEQICGRGMPAWKRGIDIFASVILLVCLLPLFLLIGLIIIIISPGPIFFKQKRVGYQGEEFIMWKFRTMMVDADASPHESRVREEITNDMPLRKLDEDHDPRIIPFGNILRQTGLDELPQLFNILRGEMSLVGPRPDPVYAVRDYQPWHKARLDVVPGVTGLWQVNGKNKTMFKDMIRLDIRYTRQRSFWVDVKILLRTLPAIIDQVKGGISTEG